MTLAPLCDVLEVEYKTDGRGRHSPSKETLEQIIEALLHQIGAMDVDIKALLQRLWLEMHRSKYPHTTKDEWNILQSLDVTDD